MDIELRAINKSYDGQKVIDDLSATIKGNRITCIMGESGIGKTTLINMILGLEKPDSGQIIGIEDKKIGAVFQEDRLCEEFNCVQNLRLVCNKDISDNKLTKTLEALGLSDAANKKVSSLSGGMKRRLAIGRALVFDADILIMDEPFKGLDRDLYIKTINLVKENSRKKTLIIVTHILEEAKILEADVIYLE